MGAVSIYIYLILKVKRINGDVGRHFHRRIIDGTRPLAQKEPDQKKAKYRPLPYVVDAGFQYQKKSGAKLSNNLIVVLPCHRNMKIEDSFRHQGMRRNLVLQLQQKGIQSARVLEAIGKIPRHFFFDKSFHNHAYQDKAFPIGEGQTISQPYTVARQTELLEIRPGHKILEIGTGSGYQTAVLMELGATVFTIEYQPILFQRTKKQLPILGYRANFFLGDGSQGIPAFGPYDRILVTAGAPSVPQPLIDQLKPGGILIIPAGDSESQEMLKIEKLPDGSLIEKKHGNFAFVPLKGSFGWS